jgi:ATP-binding cassette, subfamily B, bacterial MsbA
LKYWLEQLIDIAKCAWRIRAFLRPGRYLVAAVLISLLVMAALEGVGVSLLVPLLSLLLGGEGSTPTRPLVWLHAWFPGHGAAYYISAFAIFIVLVIALKNAVLYGSQILAARLKRRVSIHLRDALFEKLHRADLSVFEQTTAGQLASLFLTDTVRSIGAIDSLLLFGQRASIGIFYVVALFVISWPLTLLTMFLAAIVGGSIAFLYRKLTLKGAQITDLNRQLSSRLVESFTGIRVIRTTNSQHAEKRRFHEFVDMHAAVEEASMRHSSLLTPIAETVAVTGAMIIIGSAYIFLVRPGFMLNSYLLAFGFILLRLLPLLNQLYSLQGNVLYMAGGLREVERWMNTLPPAPMNFGEVEFKGVRDEITFANVSFTYPNGTTALVNVDLQIPAGKTIALVGASGSGKSTIATLLLRLRAATSGSITIDGRDLWDFTPESWHRLIGVVEQEAFLFHDTFAQNISYGYPQATRAEIEAAVRAAHLEDVVAALPDGLNTVVGERGTMLSGGQRQRLAIARALVRNPKILILDEATSALDNISERKVQLALEEAMLGRTVLVIAHRLSTIRNADELVVLSEGRVIERGTWSELEASRGLFSEFITEPSVLGTVAVDLHLVNS